MADWTKLIPLRLRKEPPQDDALGRERARLNEKTDRLRALVEEMQSKVEGAKDA